MRNKKLILLLVIFVILTCTIGTVVAYAEPGDATNNIINIYPHVVTVINGLYDMDIELYGYTIDQSGLILPFYGHITVNGLAVTINEQTGGAQILNEYLLTTDKERHILGINGNIADIYNYTQTVKMINTNDVYYTFDNAKSGTNITVEKTVLIFESVNGVGISTKQLITGKGLQIGERLYNITNTAGFWVTEKNTIYDNYFTRHYMTYAYDGEELYDTAYQYGVDSANNTVTETSESYKRGYAKGYYDGYENSGDIHFIDVITAVFDVPTQWLTNLLDYDVLGFNLKTFFQSVVTITIVIAILKMII